MLASLRPPQSRRTISKMLFLKSQLPGAIHSLAVSRRCTQSNRNGCLLRRNQSGLRVRTGHGHGRGRRRPRARRVGRGRAEGRRTWRIPQRGGRAAKPARDFPAAYVDRTHRLSPTSARARARVKRKQARASSFRPGTSSVQLAGSLSTTNEKDV